MSSHFDPFGLAESAQRDLHQRRRTAAQRSDKSADRQTISNLEDRLDRLSLVCMAMWSLLQDKARLTEDDLLERVRTLDLMDGVADNKATRSVSKCARCQRTMSSRHRRCLYCGFEQTAQSAFDNL